MTVLAVFRCRTQAVDCAQRLRALGLPARLVPTPREANVGCGLSVLLPADCLARAKRAIAGANYSAFYGYLNAGYGGNAK